MKPEDITHYSTADFYAMSIAKLRDVAAFLGVDSPTTKPKGELVELVNQAMSGLIPIIPQKIGRGRPTKGPKGEYFIDWELISSRNTADDEFVSMNIVFHDNSDENIEFMTRKGRYGQSEIQPISQNIMQSFEGSLDIMSEGYGFIRTNKFSNSRGDAYVHAKIIKCNDLRKGDYIVAQGMKQYEGKPASISIINTVNAKCISEIKNRPRFEELAAIYPNERYVLGVSQDDISNRLIDIVCPIGKGQRAMISSPTQGGKTTLIRDIANSLSVNYPETLTYIILVAERPEEVTELTNSVHCPVIFSTFEECPERHIRICEIAFERAMRDVEEGLDVVVFIDSMTSLARAYNMIADSNCRSTVCDIDYDALSQAKKIFSRAKNTDKQGSLTVIATFNIGSGSNIDDVIYNEFKCTCNMEINLSDECVCAGVYPAIDIHNSSTKRVDLLLSPCEMKINIALKAMLNDTQVDCTRNILKLIAQTNSNDDLYCVVVK